MARRPRDNDFDRQEDLNLAPFMNLVIILIPILLLSVVLLEVSVINVTMPLGGSATTDEPDEEEERLDLAIAIAPNGFYVTASGNIHQPIDGCPEQGPTICLAEESVDVQARLEESRRLTEGGDVVVGEEVLEEVLRAYDYRALYNLLAEFKNDFPDETTVRLTADSHIPFALTVRVMDVSRYRLEEDSYDNDAAFWSAAYRTEMADDGEEQYANLFGDPAFAVAQ